MAATALRLVMDPEIREKARAEHERLVAEYNK
jgi:hypothetical protein